MSTIPSAVSMIKTRFRNKTKTASDVTMAAKINGSDRRSIGDSLEEEGVYAGIDEHPGLFNNVNANNRVHVTSQWPLPRNNGGESNCTYAQLDHASSSGE